MATNVLQFPKSSAKEGAALSPEMLLIREIFRQLPHGRKNMVRFNIAGLAGTSAARASAILAEML